MLTNMFATYLLPSISFFPKSSATLPSSAVVERLFSGTNSDCTKMSYGGQYAPQTVVSEIWQCGSIFIRLAVVAPPPNMPTIEQNSEKIFNLQQFKVIQGRWFWHQLKARIRAPIVINSNFGPILHRFWDTATYWLKIAYFSYPSLIRRPRSLLSTINNKQE